VAKHAPFLLEGPVVAGEASGGRTL
jgi:hypothetical protein